MVHDTTADVTIKAINETDKFLRVECSDETAADVAGRDKLMERHYIPLVVAPGLDLQTLKCFHFVDGFQIPENDRR